VQQDQETQSHHFDEGGPWGWTIVGASLWVGLCGWTLVCGPLWMAFRALVQMLWYKHAFCQLALIALGIQGWMFIECKLDGYGCYAFGRGWTSTDI